MEKVQIYIGIVLNKKDEQVWFATCGTNRMKCAVECEKQFPGQPFHIIELMDNVAFVKQNLFYFLKENEVPQDQWPEILQLIANGLKKNFEKKK